MPVEANLEKLIPDGITAKQREVLEAIPPKGSISLVELSESLGLHPSTMKNRLRRVDRKFPGLLGRRDAHAVGLKGKNKEVYFQQAPPQTAEVSLSGAARRIYDALEDNGNMGRQHLADFLDYKPRSGSFVTAIKKLKEQGLIHSFHEPGKRGVTIGLVDTGAEDKPLEDLPVVKNIYMGEMGFGTKAFNTESMTGLRYFLEYNDHTDITNVMMLGAMVPEIPEYYSVSGSEKMRFLAQDPTKPHSKKIEMILKTKKLKKSDAKYFEDHVDRKIKTRQDAVNASRAEIAKLADLLEDAEWHYQHGEEDRANIRVAKEIMIADAAEKKRNLEQYNAEIEDLRAKQEEYEKEGTLLKQKSKYLHSLTRRIERKTEGMSRAEFRSYLQEIVDTELPTASVDARTREDITRLLTLKTVTTDRIRKENTKLKQDAVALKQDERSVGQSIKEYKHKIDAVKRQKEAWDFFRGTKRHKIEADEEEIFFRLAKTEYNDILYGVFPDDIRERCHIHSSAFNELTDPLTTRDASVPATGSEDEYAVVDSGGLIYLLAHNPNILLSNTATKKDLAMLKDEAKKLVKLHKELGIPIPDVTMSSHGRGGFRWQPQLKYRETIVKGQHRLIPEMVLHIKLPTLQSVPKLQDLCNRGVKTVHTKRFLAKNYASGVVLHTVYDKSNFELEFIDESSLRQYAEWGRELDKKKAYLDKVQDPDEKAALRKDIRSLKRKLKSKPKGGDKASLPDLLEKAEAQLETLVDTSKIKKEEEAASKLEAVLRIESDKVEPDGDSHLGASNRPGRRSNYEIVDAIARYQRERGLPDVLIVSEAIHAPIGHVCNTNEQYWGNTPKGFQDMVEAIKQGPYDDAEKIRRIEQIAHEQIAATPITHTDVVLKEWKMRCLPYVTEVLDKGGRVIFVSGNHYNKSGSGRDEATAMANIVPPQYTDQVEVFDSLGDSNGCGETFLPSGKKLYSSHKLRAGIDEFVNAFEQMLKQGIDADLVVFFHLHHGGGGFADGTVYTMSPGRQSWSTYIDQISKLSSPKGVINTHVARHPEITHVRWEAALDDCLERHYMDPVIRDQPLEERKSHIPIYPKRPDSRRK